MLGGTFLPVSILCWHALLDSATSPAWLELLEEQIQGSGHRTRSATTCRVWNAVLSTGRRIRVGSIAGDSAPVGSEPTAQEFQTGIVDYFMAAVV